MKNLNLIRERYLQDPVNVRLGGLAADLSRIASFMASPKNAKAVDSLVEESKFFIEWVAPEADLDLQVLLVEIQLELALWQQRKEKDLAKKAQLWSKRILRSSGLL